MGTELQKLNNQNKAEEWAERIAECRRSGIPVNRYCGGARGSAVIFTLIQTAIENGLEPYRYLTWLMHTAIGLDLSTADAVQQILHWNAPAECKTK